jgi:hypothetical protein
VVIGHHPEESADMIIAEHGLLNNDEVERYSRQLLYGSASVGQRKLDAARERLHDINPSVAIETQAMRLSQENALAMRFREFKIRRNPHCPLCGEQPTITSLGNYDALSGLRATTGAEAVPEISVHELHACQMRGEAFALVDVRGPAEYAIANLGGKLIPLDDLAGRLSELGEYRDTTFVVYCRC